MTFSYQPSGIRNPLTGLGLMRQLRQPGRTPIASGKAAGRQRIMQFRYSLLATSAVLAVTLGNSSQAQTTSSTAAASSTTIEELVVTAEKRQQNLQDVPVAISAFTSEK